MKKLPPTSEVDLSSLAERLKTMGTCHVSGVKDVKNITPLIELAGRKCVIISDGDAPAKEKQKEHQNTNGHGIWKRYDEMKSSPKVETSEDFIKYDVFLDAVSKLKKQYPVLIGDPAVSVNGGRCDEVKKWIIAQGVQQDTARVMLDNLKTIIFDNLKPADIDILYYNFLKDLSEIINAN